MANTNQEIPSDSIDASPISLPTKIELGLYKFLNFFFHYQCLYLITIDTHEMDQKYLKIPEGYVFKQARADEIKRYASTRKMELDQDWCQKAMDNGDHCLALFEDEEIAGYGWYSQLPTPITGEYQINYPTTFWYQHHGYTSSEHRGKRLHAVGMANALKTIAQIGSPRMIAIVAMDNVASLKSCKRLGFKELGRFYIFSRFSHYFIFRTGFLKRYGVYLEAIRDGFKFVKIN